MDKELRIRRALPEDRPAMERICAHTWDSGDYIQEVWDEWLADEEGVLLVAELGGQVVSLNKVTFQPGGQVWLEGMRVDPDYRGRGIASRGLEYNLAYARQQRARVVRLATGGNNTAVHAMVGKAGMEPVGRYVLYNAEPLPGEARPAILGPQHRTQADAFLAKSRVLAGQRGLYSRDWAWQELAPERLSEMLAAGQVAALPAAGGELAAMATIHVHPGAEEMWIGFADIAPGEQERALAGLARAIRAQAAEAGVKWVRAMLADLAWQRAALAAAGFGTGEWEGELWIFEWQVDERARAEGEASDVAASGHTPGAAGFEGERDEA